MTINTLKHAKYVPESDRTRILSAIKNTPFLREAAFLFSKGVQIRLSDVPPGDIVPGTGSVESHDGLGDVSLAAKYVFISGANLPVLGFSTKLKASPPCKAGWI